LEPRSQASTNDGDVPVMPNLCVFGNAFKEEADLVVVVKEDKGEVVHVKELDKGEAQGWIDALKGADFVAGANTAPHDTAIHGHAHANARTAAVTTASMRSALHASVSRAGLYTTNNKRRSSPLANVSAGRARMGTYRAERTNSTATAVCVGRSALTPHASSGTAENAMAACTVSTPMLSAPHTASAAASTAASAHVVPRQDVAPHHQRDQRWYAMPYASSAK